MAMPLRFLHICETRSRAGKKASQLPAIHDTEMLSGNANSILVR